MTSHLTATSETSAFHLKLAECFSRIRKTVKNMALVELVPEFNTPATALVTPLLYQCH